MCVCGLMKSCLPPRSTLIRYKYWRGDFHLRFMEDILGDAAYSSSPKKQHIPPPSIVFSNNNVFAKGSIPVKLLTSSHFWIHFYQWLLALFHHTVTALLTLFRSFSIITPEFLFNVRGGVIARRCYGHRLLFFRSSNQPTSTLFCTSSADNGVFFSAQHPLNSFEQSQFRSMAAAASVFLKIGLDREQAPPTVCRGFSPVQLDSPSGPLLLVSPYLPNPCRMGAEMELQITCIQSAIGHWG